MKNHHFRNLPKNPSQSPYLIPISFLRFVPVHSLIDTLKGAIYNRPFMHYCLSIILAVIE